MHMPEARQTDQSPSWICLDEFGKRSNSKIGSTKKKNYMEIMIIYQNQTKVAA